MMTHSAEHTKGKLSNAFRWVLAIVCALLLGAFIGFCVMLAFDAAYWIINAIWIAGWHAADMQLFPLFVCTSAGLLLSLLVWKYGKPTRPLEAARTTKPAAAEDVSGEDSSASPSRPADVKRRPLLVKLADFFLPFAGGGPVGVAMGIVGFIISGSAWIKRKLVALCVSAGIMQSAAELSKQQRIALYIPAIVGSLVGFGIVVRFLGVAMVIPRFEAAPLSAEALLWAALLALAGWALGAIYLLVSKAAQGLWNRAGHKQRFLPLVCGIALGLSMIVMPHVGLPGSDAYSYQLLGEWVQTDPFLLMATAIVRVVLIAFLLNMGWSGGPFFPLAYCAICMGFGVAEASGLEPGLCVAAMMASILVAFSGQPLFGIVALVCCPVESIPVIVVASIVSALIPKPKAIAGEFGKLRKRK